MNKQKIQAVRDKASECFEEASYLLESLSDDKAIELHVACGFLNKAILALDDALGIEE